MEKIHCLCAVYFCFIVCYLQKLRHGENVIHHIFLVWFGLVQTKTVLFLLPSVWKLLILGLVSSMGIFAIFINNVWLCVMTIILITTAAAAATQVYDERRGRKKTTKNHPCHVASNKITIFSIEMNFIFIYIIRDSWHRYKQTNTHTHACYS